MDGEKITEGLYDITAAIEKLVTECPWEFAVPALATVAAKKISNCVSVEKQSEIADKFCKMVCATVERNKSDPPLKEMLN